MDEGYNPAYGARPLRRAIMRLLEDSMAERMLAGEIKVCMNLILFLFGSQMTCVLLVYVNAIVRLLADSMANGMLSATSRAR